MFQLGRDPKQDGIPRACVDGFAQRLPRGRLAQTEDAPVVGVRPEIHAHTDQSASRRVAMPRIVVTGAGNHPVDPAEKTPDAAAARDLSNHAEQPRIVAHKEQEAQRDVVVQAEFDTDVLMDPDVESRIFNVFLDGAQEFRVEESGQANAMLAGKLRAKTIQITHRVRDDWS